MIFIGSTINREVRDAGWGEILYIIILSGAIGVILLERNFNRKMLNALEPHGVELRGEVFFGLREHPRFCFLAHDLLKHWAGKFGAMYFAQSSIYMENEDAYEILKPFDVEIGPIAQAVSKFEDRTIARGIPLKIWLTPLIVFVALTTWWVTYGATHGFVDDLLWVLGFLALVISGVVGWILYAKWLGNKYREMGLKFKPVFDSLPDEALHRVIANAYARKMWEAGNE
ncbi:MAG: hypothetical protein KDC26_04805 [Armatimonadetes bacterium]|nr:hypothetical protein [Armatimonadota bacterium]